VLDTVLDLDIAPSGAGTRLDRALTEAAGTALSRSRIAQLIAEGAVTDARGATVVEARRKVKAGERYRLTLPRPAPAEPEPEAIPLAILHEDAHLLVIDKPAGMVVHPAPGAARGTLVNALLAHCGDSLAGIGGTRRPGIVHRIDKDTSGLIVVAKTETALAGLAAQFADHSIERRYLAVLRGVPDPQGRRLQGRPGIGVEPGGTLRVEAAIGRHPTDRKRMAVLGCGGRRAVTRFESVEPFGRAACLAVCRLETGRTHQIRVHAAHIGHALIGDPVYGRTPLPGLAQMPPEPARALAGLARQALHAARLGFVHPVTGARLGFDSPLPADIAEVIGILRRNAPDLR